MALKLLSPALKVKIRRNRGKLLILLYFYLSYSFHVYSICFLLIKKKTIEHICHVPGIALQYLSCPRGFRCFKKAYVGKGDQWVTNLECVPLVILLLAVLTDNIQRHK